MRSIMDPLKAVITIIEAGIIFRAVRWMLNSQQPSDRVQKVVRWSCVSVFALLAVLAATGQRTNSVLGLLVLIGSLFCLVLCLLLPDIAYYLTSFVRKISLGK